MVVESREGCSLESWVCGGGETGGGTGGASGGGGGEMEFLEHLGQECKPDLVVDYITGLVAEEAVDSDRLVESREGCSLELWVCDGGGGGGGGDGGGEVEFLVHLVEELEEIDGVALMVVDYVSGLGVEEAVDIDRLALMVVDYRPGLGEEDAEELLVYSAEECRPELVVEESEEDDGLALMVVAYRPGLVADELLVYLEECRPELVVEESEEDDGLALMVVAYRPGLVADELLVYLAEECRPELVVESRSEMAVHRGEAKVYEKAVDGSSDACAKLAI